MLTGESVPVDKIADAVAPDGDVPLAERDGMGFMNTTLVRGRAVMAVTDTGMGTEIGRLAELLNVAEEKQTPLQRQLDDLGRRLAMVAGIAVVIVFVVALLQADSITKKTFNEALLTSVALAVAAIPEGLPGSCLCNARHWREPTGQTERDRQEARLGRDPRLDECHLLR